MFPVFRFVLENFYLVCRFCSTKKPKKKQTKKDFVMSDAVLDSIVQWFRNNSKTPLTKEEQNAVKQQLSEAGIDAELLALAEDADLRELCPVSFNLTRKWQLKEALRSTRGMCFPYIFFFLLFFCGGLLLFFTPALRAKPSRERKPTEKHLLPFKGRRRRRNPGKRLWTEPRIVEFCCRSIFFLFFSFSFLSLLKIPPSSPAKLRPGRPARRLQQVSQFFS